MLAIMLLIMSVIMMVGIIWVGYCKDDLATKYGANYMDQQDCDTAIVVF